jgi:phage baseplate assembly protein W
MLIPAFNISDFNDANIGSSRIGKKQLFADLDLKFIKHPIKKDVVPLIDIQAVKNSVKNLILTNFYERPFKPFLGSDVAALLFENATVFTAHKLQNQILRVLEEYEPRIADIVVQIFDYSNENKYNVTITFNVIGINQKGEVNFFLRRLR